MNKYNKKDLESLGNLFLDHEEGVGWISSDLVSWSDGTMCFIVDTGKGVKYRNTIRIEQIYEED